MMMMNIMSKKRIPLHTQQTVLLLTFRITTCINIVVLSPINMCYMMHAHAGIDRYCSTDFVVMIGMTIMQIGGHLMPARGMHTT